MASVLIVGLVTLLGQVVLLREIGVAFHGSELAYVLGFGVWLCGTALGAARRDDGDPVTALRLAGWAVPAALVLARALRPLLGTVTGAEPGLVRLGLGLVLILGPVGYPRRRRLPPHRQRPPRRGRHAGPHLRRREPRRRGRRTGGHAAAGHRRARPRGRLARRAGRVGGAPAARGPCWRRSRWPASPRRRGSTRG